jgi:hypothetical protein
MVPRPPPTSPPPSCHEAGPATHRKTGKERQLVDGRSGEGGGRGAESYDSKKAKKAWTSISHSILSVLEDLVGALSPSLETFQEPRNRFRQAGNRFLGSLKALQMWALTR